MFLRCWFLLRVYSCSFSGSRFKDQAFQAGLEVLTSTLGITAASGYRGDYLDGVAIHHHLDVFTALGMDLPVHARFTAEQVEFPLDERIDLVSHFSSLTPALLR